MIRVSENLPMVHALLGAHGISAESLVVAPDVQAWCDENGVQEENPFRAAKCFYDSDRCFIVIRNVQTDAMIRSGKDSMELNGFGKQVRQLDSDRKYLEHLILHEIGCLVLQTGEQAARDRWAFLRMGIE